MDEQGRCLLSKVCKKKQGTVDIPGKFNPISYKRSLRGEPIEAVKEEVRVLVSSKTGVVVFAQDLDVEYLGLWPELCQVIHVQKDFNARIGVKSLAWQPRPFPLSHQMENTL